MPDIKWFGCAERNFRRGRPAHLAVEAIVIHIIDGSQAGADATFLDNTLSNPRSAHYSVGRDGAIHQYVQESDTAFHAGVVVNPTWAAMKKDSSGAYVNPNFYTIGIEHDGRADDEWTDAMYAASSALIHAIAARYPEHLGQLDRNNVVMHREIRANKTCPGFKVDMNRLIAGALQPGTQPEVRPLVVVARGAVNLRLGSPSTSSPVARVLPNGAMLNVLRKVGGQSVTGRDNQPNNQWYETLETEFVWSGAVDSREPLP